MKNDLRETIEKMFPQATDSKYRIGLITPSYGVDEIMEILDSLLKLEVTMGKKVHEFERLFAEYVGVKNGVMVNSGSSADLIAVAALANSYFKHKIRPGDEIITPSVTWSTTVFSIINAGAVPVMVDVGEDYLIDAEQIKENITDKTRAIMPVHLLGNPCDMKAIADIAEDHKLFVIEDCCEAHGAEFHGQKVGSFGATSAFSFFFSHHISTIEGGMVMVNDEDIANISRMLRAHGWVREVSNKEKIEKMFGNIDPKYLFYNFGYNLRPTELQGAMGLHQIKKLEEFIEDRRANAEYFNKKLKQFDDVFLLPEEKPNTRHVWFGYPLTIKGNAGFTRKELTDHLKSKGIETRPVMSGNMCVHPSMSFLKHRKGRLGNTENIDKNSFFFGIHQGITEDDRKYAVNCIGDFVTNRK